jgi:hypothetical protein
MNASIANSISRVYTYMFNGIPWREKTQVLFPLDQLIKLTGIQRDVNGYSKVQENRFSYLIMVFFMK